MFVEKAVAWNIFRKPDEPELRTVTGWNSVPSVQLTKFSKVLGLGESMPSVGEKPCSSAAASVKTLKVDPACMPMVPPKPWSTL